MHLLHETLYVCGVRLVVLECKSSVNMSSYTPVAGRSNNCRTFCTIYVIKAITFPGFKHGFNKALRREGLSIALRHRGRGTLETFVVDRLRIRKVRDEKVLLRVIHCSSCLSLFVTSLDKSNSIITQSLRIPELSRFYYIHACFVGCSDEARFRTQ